MSDMPEVDAILDLARACYRMSIVKTRWYGPNAMRRFRTCERGRCGFHVWIEEEPLGDCTLEIIKEFQERAIKRDDLFFRKMDRMRERHEVELARLKRKQSLTLGAMFVLLSMMLNLVISGIPEPENVEELDEVEYDYDE